MYVPHISAKETKEQEKIKPQSTKMCQKASYNLVTIWLTILALGGSWQKCGSIWSAHQAEPFGTWEC